VAVTVGNGVVRALAHELLDTESSEVFARMARRVLLAEFELDEVELVGEGGAVRLRTVPDRVPADVADAVVDLWRVACRVEQLAHDATHDPLTGLMNRRSFDSKLAQALAGADRYGWSFALVLVDLDGLKAINDEHGHAVGDAVLQAVGEHLVGSVRMEDAAARLGGDEFGLIVMEADATRVCDLMERVTAAVNATLPGLVVTLSSGTAMVPDDGRDAAALTRLADERLYASKRA
jgi:diguanylate cyclase (GGDEF)-like protein